MYLRDMMCSGLGSGIFRLKWIQARRAQPRSRGFDFNRLHRRHHTHTHSHSLSTRSRIPIHQCDNDNNVVLFNRANDIWFFRVELVHTITTVANDCFALNVAAGREFISSARAQRVEWVSEPIKNRLNGNYTCSSGFETKKAEPMPTWREKKYHYRATDCRLLNGMPRTHVINDQQMIGKFANVHLFCRFLNKLLWMIGPQHNDS